ncbi:hypothetical protein [Nocardia transvalensis]|uniref:hypothetical protein n=1 Tax=Nocardia transvalensis TaxID=37333 RepID=UPI0018943763|nr:hypothetical protein [Nocardia transvalensis]MBF6333457.1 hypothetical protein [Nocardia transvalensis]
MALDFRFTVRIPLGRVMSSDDDRDSYSGGRGGRESFDIGNAFRDGRAEIMGRTEANGWQKEVRVRLPNGEWRKLDIAKIRNGMVERGVENKVGKRIKPSKELFRQIEKDIVLARDLRIPIVWEVSGKIPKSVADALERANRETRGRFTLVRVSRAERNAAFQRAKELARDKAREQKQALARYMERLKLARERSERAKQRERDEREARAQERARVEREAAERVAREFTPPAQLVRGRDEPDVAEKGGREEPDPAEKARQREREAAIEKARQQQREAADRLAAVAREAREAAGTGKVLDMSREVADLLRVARPTPGIESPHREPPEAGSTRGGREERERARVKGIPPRFPGEKG